MAMNITIDQSSIEAAIETHVRELIPGLAEDTVISITLSATRGPSGFTASIDLLPAGTVKTPAVTPVPTPVETKPTKASKTLNIPKTNEKTVEETPIDNVVDTTDTPNESQKELPFVSSEETDEVVSGDLATQEEAEQPTETNEAPPRASLFSGLNKPKN